MKGNVTITVDFLNTRIGKLLNDYAHERNISYHSAASKALEEALGEKITLSFDDHSLSVTLPSEYISKRHEDNLFDEAFLYESLEKGIKLLKANI